MRISTGMIYDAGLASMQKRTATLLNTQQQLSEGRRILKPSDDPVAAARALEVTQAQEVNANQTTTRENVKSTLGIIDGQIESAENLMMRVRELAVQAGNASLSINDRRSIANELRARFEEMMSLANTRDGNGLYLFGGYQTGSQPFAGSVESGVTYGGDDGARMLRVSGSRELPVSDSGNDVFMRIKNGNGVFVAAMQNDKPANATHVTYEGATLANPPATTGTYELRFWTDTAGTVKTSAQAVGTTVDLTALAGGYPATFTDGVDSQMTITVDGVAQLVDLDPAGTGTAYADADAIVSAVQAAVGASATISMSTTGRLVVTSASSGAPTSTLAVAPSALVTRLFGGTTITNGINGAAGTTYADIVDPTTGVSLYTNSASTAGGTTNTYTHAYQSGTPFDLSSAGPFAFDFGADAVLTGTAASGDTFTLVRDATTLSLTGKTFNANAARATVDAGSVSNPDLWRQSANSGDLEVRFWVDVAGTVTGAGQAVGTATMPSALTVVAGTADQFTINVDGAGVRTVTIPPGAYASEAAIAAAIQNGIDALAAPPVAATVTLDAANKIVVTSDTPGATSSIAIAAGAGARDGLARFFGTPASTAGFAGAAGATYYDLVDATTGESLFTGGTSTTGGAGNTYTHRYVSGSAISLSSAGGPGQAAFDFGASVTVSGIAAGSDAFTIKTDDAYYGNGYFVTAAKTATTVNTGSGVIGTGEIRNPALWDQPANSRNLEIRFWKDATAMPPVLYYDLVDAETEKSLFSNTTSAAGGSGNTYTHPFVAGDSIPFSGLNVPYAGPPATTATDFGISVSITGTPASGDSFKIQASESTSVFDTMAQLIGALESGSPPGTTGNTHLANGLSTALASVGQIEDNLLRVRASIGSRLNEVDDLDTVGQNLDLQYSETLSRLQDLDYAEAITHLTRQQMELQAAQQSFAKVSRLSLFDYL